MIHLPLPNDSENGPEMLVPHVDVCHATPPEWHKARQKQKNHRRQKAVGGASDADLGEASL